MGNFHQPHKTRVGGYPLRCSLKLVELGARSTFFMDLEFLGPRRLARKIWSGAVFLDLELLGAVPHALNARSLLSGFEF